LLILQLLLVLSSVLQLIEYVCTLCFELGIVTCTQFEAVADAPGGHHWVHFLRGVGKKNLPLNVAVQVGCCCGGFGGSASRKCGVCDDNNHIYEHCHHHMFLFAVCGSGKHEPWPQRPRTLPC
jgi:hypothetical protein